NHQGPGPDGISPGPRRDLSENTPIRQGQLSKSGSVDSACRRDLGRRGPEVTPSGATIRPGGPAGAEPRPRGRQAGSRGPGCSGAFGVDLVDFLGAAFFGAAFGLLAGFDVLPVFGVPAFFTAIGLTSLQDIFA